MSYLEKGACAIDMVTGAQVRCEFVEGQLYTVVDDKGVRKLKATRTEDYFGIVSKVGKAGIYVLFPSFSKAIFLLNSSQLNLVDEEMGT